MTETKKSTDQRGGASEQAPASEPCCSPSEQAACCEPQAKSTCCSTPAGCGCR